MKNKLFCKTVIFAAVLVFLCLTDVAAQDANDPVKLNQDLNRTEDEIIGAVVGAGKNLARDTEKALKNDAKTDVEIEKRLLASTPSLPPTSVQDGSLDADVGKLQQEADSLN